MAEAPTEPATDGNDRPLSTERLLLRPLEPGDVDDFFAIFSDPEVARYTSRPPLPDLAAARVRVDELSASSGRGQDWTWAVCRRDEGRLLGTVALFHFEAEQGRAEIGYVFGRSAWGHGYATEAMGAVLDLAFHTLGLRRLEADADPRNAASLRVLERLGFTREGLLRERWCVAGEIQDTVVFGILKREWRA